MAKTQKDRDEATTKRRQAAGEVELRHRVRPGILTILAELMDWGEHTERTECLQTLLLNVHALGRPAPAAAPRNPHLAQCGAPALPARRRTSRPTGSARAVTHPNHTPAASAARDRSFWRKPCKSSMQRRSGSAANVERYTTTKTVRANAACRTFTSSGSARSARRCTTKSTKPTPAANSWCVAPAAAVTTALAASWRSLSASPATAAGATHSSAWSTRCRSKISTPNLVAIAGG